jgi:K+-transporting ATPase ATPase A chain
MLEGFIQIALTLLLLVAIVPFLSRYMARVFLGERTLLDPVMTPVESLIYKAGGIRARETMTGWQYARAVICSNLRWLFLSP